jgi:hypothetical protein
MKLSKNNFDLLSTALPLGIAALAKIALDNRYEAATGKAAPRNLDSDEASVAKVIMYTALTAAVGISVKILVRKFLTNQWKKMDGELPDHIS